MDMPIGNKEGITASNEETWDFMDVIYETAHDPNFWPLALEGLKSEIDLLESKINATNLSSKLQTNNTIEFNSNYLIPGISPSFSIKSISSTELSLISKLQPHFQRAFEINSRYQELKKEKDATSCLLDRLPIGIIFTDIKGKVITLNSFAKSIMDNDSYLSIKNDVIQTTDHNKSNELHTFIRCAHANKNQLENNEINSIEFPKTSTSSSLSILVTPHIVSNTLASQQHNVVLFIVSDNSNLAINEKALSAIFGLSVTEAIITKHIASGKTLAQYCEKHGVTTNTVRSQLKLIFSKTNTHSQSELSNRVLTSPAIFVSQKNTQTKEVASNFEKISFPNFFDDQNVIELSDGRSLCFADIGDKLGIPVLLCHGSYGCRLERYPDDSIASNLGIRLIIPDRPGYGFSTALNDQKGLEWCDDFEFLLNKLKIKKIHIMSTGSGSYYALACAQEKTERISGITLINSLAPFHSIKEFSGMISHEKIFYAMARYTPGLFKRFLELCNIGLSKNIDYYFDSIKSVGGEPDTMALSNDKLTQFIRKKVFAAIKNSPQGFIQERILMTKPWDINISAIQTKITIVTGGKQLSIPSSMSQRLHSILPNSLYQEFPEQGTYLIYMKWRELLESIKKF